MSDRKRPKWSEDQWAFARGYLTPDIAAAERRRIRRAIAPALRHLKAHAQNVVCPSCVEDADIIDRATKAPRGRAPGKRPGRARTVGG